MVHWQIRYADPAFVAGFFADAQSPQKQVLSSIRPAEASDRQLIESTNLTWPIGAPPKIPLHVHNSSQANFLSAFPDIKIIIPHPRRLRSFPDVLVWTQLKHRSRGCTRCCPASRRKLFLVRSVNGNPWRCGALRKPSGPDRVLLGTIIILAR